MHRVLRRARVHVFKAVLQRLQVLGRHQLRLADENLVRKAHLAACFLAVIELFGRVFGVHQGQYGVEQVRLGHLVVHKKGLRHRSWVGQAGGLYHHAVKVKLAFALFLGQVAQGGAQVLADGAADAAIAHLDDLLGGVGHQNIAVDVFLAKLVFDDGDFLPMRLGENALEHGGLASAQKAGQDGGGNEGHGCFFRWYCEAPIFAACGRAQAVQGQ